MWRLRLSRSTFPFAVTVLLSVPILVTLVPSFAFYFVAHARIIRYYEYHSAMYHHTQHYLIYYRTLDLAISDFLSRFAIFARMRSDFLSRFAIFARMKSNFLSRFAIFARTRSDFLSRFVIFARMRSDFVARVIFRGEPVPVDQLRSTCRRGSHDDELTVVVV